jgi:hypothetical protein
MAGKLDYALRMVFDIFSARQNLDRIPDDVSGPIPDKVLPRQELG